MRYRTRRQQKMPLWPLPPPQIRSLLLHLQRFQHFRTGWASPQAATTPRSTPLQPSLRNVQRTGRNPRSTHPSSADRQRLRQAPGQRRRYWRRELPGRRTRRPTALSCLVPHSADDAARAHIGLVPRTDGDLRPFPHFPCRHW